MSTDLEIAEKNLVALASESEPLYFPTGRMRRSRAGLTRAEVVRTFEIAFEQIGGIPRLAVWADTNPSEFFKLYGRLLPSSNSNELDGDSTIVIKHVLPAPPRHDDEPG
jgi:hypothetical protein